MGDEKIDIEIKTLLTALAASVLGQGLLTGILKLYPVSAPVWRMILGVLPFQICPLLAVLFGMWPRIRQHGWWQVFDWSKEDEGWSIVLKRHVFLLLITVVAFIALNGFTVFVCGIMGVTLPEQPIIALARQENRLVFWGIFLFTTIMLAPLVEEMVFRRLLYNAVLDAWMRCHGEASGENAEACSAIQEKGRRLAACVTALAFALLHGMLYFLPTLFVLGILFQQAKNKGGLRQSVLLHASYNACIVGLLIVSRQWAEH